jgi:hypothetical protein
MSWPHRRRPQTLLLVCGRGHLPLPATAPLLWCVGGHSTSPAGVFGSRWCLPSGLLGGLSGVAPCALGILNAVLVGCGSSLLLLVFVAGQGRSVPFRAVAVPHLLPRPGLHHRITLRPSLRSRMRGVGFGAWKKPCPTLSVQQRLRSLA